MATSPKQSLMSSLSKFETEIAQEVKGMGAVIFIALISLLEQRFLLTRGLLRELDNETADTDQIIARLDELSRV